MTVVEAAGAAPTSGAPQAPGATEPAAPTSAAPTAPPAAPAADAPDSAAVERRDYTQRLATLSAKEKQFQARAEKTRAELQAERQAIEQRQREVAEAIEFQREYRTLREQAKRDPLRFMEAHGLTYEDVTQFVLNNGQPDPVTAVRSELETWRKQQEEERKAAQEAQRKQHEQHAARAIQQWKAGVTNYVKQNAETYELIHLHNQFDLVPQVIEEHYRQTEAAGLPVLLTEKEAADKVEAWLVEQAERAMKAKKFQKKEPQQQTQPASTPGEPGDQKPKDAAPAQPRTISELGASVPSTPPSQQDDRMARAAAAMERAFASRGSAT